jgi:hypothetical protein
MIDMFPLNYTGELIDKHRAMGWDIAVINVGGSVNKTAVASDPSLMFDDNHHPSCEAVKLIADMMQHVLYSNLATSCTIDAAKQCSTDMPQPESQPSVNPWSTQPGVPKEGGLLWADLYREDAVFGSISLIKPSLDNVTNLRAASLDHVWSWPVMLTGDIGPGRQDRK